MLPLCSMQAKTHAADEDKMNRFIDDLMAKMTLQEKIGQLNLSVTGTIVTGQAKSSDIAGKITRGEVGGLFNLKGVKNIRDMQKIAVEQSRLKIPLLFGMDVIHGYETVFPIPFSLSCSWDMQAIKRSAQIAAQEASADGLNWTFSPMLDICVDPRWGRMAEAKWKLGLFADPYRYCNEKRAKKEIFTPAHRAEARNIAAETFVLLKNNGKILPLQKKGRIALVGPLGNSKRNMSGTWSLVARFDENKTLLQAMKEAVGDKAEVLYARGSNFMHDTKLEANAGISERDKRSDKEILDEAIAVSRNADVIVAAVGESSEMSGECCSRSSLDMPCERIKRLQAYKLEKGRDQDCELYRHSR